MGVRYFEEVYSNERTLYQYYSNIAPRSSRMSEVVWRFRTGRRRTSAVSVVLAMRPAALQACLIQLFTVPRRHRRRRTKPTCSLSGTNNAGAIGPRKQMNRSSSFLHEADPPASAVRYCCRRNKFSTSERLGGEVQTDRFDWLRGAKRSRSFFARSSIAIPLAVSCIHVAQPHTCSAFRHLYDSSLFDSRC